MDQGLAWRGLDDFELHSRAHFRYRRGFSQAERNMYVHWELSDFASCIANFITETGSTKDFTTCCGLEMHESMHAGRMATILMQKYADLSASNMQLHSFAFLILHL